MDDHKTIGCVQHDCAACRGVKEDMYTARVKQLENLGSTTSDAQAVADYEEKCGWIKDAIFREILTPTVPEPTFEYLYNEEVGNGVFDIIRLPNGELLFSFKDKHGYFNVFPTMEDYTLYVEGLDGCKYVCVEDKYIEEGEEGYEEGVDALDRYLRSLV